MTRRTPPDTSPATDKGTVDGSKGTGALGYSMSGAHQENSDGTPDANGDGIPDIWTLRVDGTVRFHSGSRTVLSGSGTEIIGNGDGIGWKNKLTVG
ncbi:hypothetical protein [Streptomyces sp. NPDC057403]|uniref:hypothetical protein n=1 Tax=Streptomyces sp. NPDC057403 TaxID=3346119 RepID=UPI0036A8CC7B